MHFVHFTDVTGCKSMQMLKVCKRFCKLLQTFGAFILFLFYFTCERGIRRYTNMCIIIIHEKDELNTFSRLKLPKHYNCSRSRIEVRPTTLRCPHAADDVRITSISANADGPRDAASRQIDHIALLNKYNYQATSVV